MSIPGNIGSFPENITELVLRFLDFDECGRCTSASSALHRGCEKIFHHTEWIRVLKGSCMEVGRGGAYRCLPTLRTLDVSQCASDTLLHNLVGLVPKLSCLRCNSSPLLTDDGVGSLAVDPECRSNLEEIDLTFCRNTTYGGTLQLRRALPRLKLIRRQPAYLDGHFLTPFGGSTIEIHTYYADGAFDFSRREQSRGYVRHFESKECQERSDNFLKDSLQYCNFDGTDMGWPEFARFLYRPGVAIRQGRHASDDDAFCAHSVLVAQNMNGMHAPDVWPPIPDNEVPLGESIYFDESGERLASGLNMQDAIGHGAVSLISRMEVRPLECLMPPLDLVEEIAAFEQLRHAFERLLQPHGVEMMQLSLHHVLGGR